MQTASKRDYAVDKPQPGRLRNSSAKVTAVFVGPLIIFTARIMDEGRKIQPEQELTV